MTGTSDSPVGIFPINQAGLIILLTFAAFVHVGAVVFAIWAASKVTAMLAEARQLTAAVEALLAPRDRTSS